MNGKETHEDQLIQSTGSRHIVSCIPNGSTREEHEQINANQIGSTAWLGAEILAGGFEMLQLGSLLFWITELP